VGSRSYDFEDERETEILAVHDLLAADRLADRHEQVDHRSVAQRAAADRRWAYGHVIIDEAQELSAMAMRMLMRRCPSRSMTIVGDIAQTGDVAGATSWDQLLRPHLADRWRLERLTVNYRTPSEIMDVATDVLALLDPGLEPPRSVRDAGVAPWRRAVDPEDLPEVLGTITATEAAAMGAGRLAVIVPAPLLRELGAAVRAAVATASVGEPLSPESTVVVCTPTQAKGLEFDVVLVAAPQQIIADSPRGLNDLYVALTRATQRLGVLHSGPAPQVLGRLAAAGDDGDGR